MPAEHQLRVHRFPAGSVLDGGVLGALERIELDDAASLLDALLVARDPGTGELQALDFACGRADGSIAALLDFRMLPDRRAAMTERVLTDHPGGVPPRTLLAIAASLRRGEALLALLQRSSARTAVDDAVARAGGHLAADEPVAATSLAEVAERLPAVT